jgi:hypothetical protein
MELLQPVSKPFDFDPSCNGVAKLDLVSPRTYVGTHAVCGITRVNLNGAIIIMRVWRNTITIRDIVNMSL